MTLASRSAASAASTARVSASAARLGRVTKSPAVVARAAAKSAPRRATLARAAEESAATVEAENVIPRVEAAFEWDEDRPFHRYRDLEHFKHDLRDVRYGGSDAGRSSGPSGKVRELPSPVTYRATLPANYDASREEPYPMLIVVPADPGYGDGLGQVGGTAAITETGFHDANGAIVLELGFNRPTWLNDAAECNHESYLLDVVLPRVLASHNVGRISLIGYANGGFGALNALFRHPHLFHRVAVCDVPVLGDFSGFARPWGVEDWNPSGDRDVDARHWWHFLDAFPHNAMFAPYNAGTLATCEYVREEIGKSAPGSPRVGLWAGSRAAWEMGELREQFEAFGVPHEWSEAWSEQPGSWSGGWLREALDFIARDM